MADVSLEVHSKRPVSQTTTEMGTEKKKIRFETTLNSCLFSPLHNPHASSQLNKYQAYM